jgi:hypothetical protein
MNTATIATASKAQRSIFADVANRIRAFAIELYSAHGGWFVLDAAQPASGASNTETDTETIPPQQHCAQPRAGRFFA